MRGAILYGPHDIRVEHRDDPTIIAPTDAITFPLDQAADGYRAMDERRAIKTLLTV